jgi:hypothetical protein
MEGKIINYWVGVRFLLFLLKPRHGGRKGGALMEAWSIRPISF